MEEVELELRRTKPAGSRKKERAGIGCVHPSQLTDKSWNSAKGGGHKKRMSPWEYAPINDLGRGGGDTFRK